MNDHVGIRGPGSGTRRKSRLSAETGYLWRPANTGISRHLVLGDLCRRRDALDLQLELVDVRRPAQCLVDGDEPLLIQAEDRLIECLHAVLRRARGDRTVNLRRAVLVDDAIANERG